MAGKMASRKKKEKAFNVLAFFIVLILAALVLLPIWWIFRSSLMSTAALNEYPPSFIPHEWLWSNYSKALETFEYWTYFKNTFTIIIPAVTFGTITAIFCGYAFARLRFRGKKLIFNICVGTILLPGMVTLIPLYIFWTKGMGLGDTYWPLILPFLTGGGFFNIFLIRQFLMTIPKELDEAASIDGAGKWKQFFQITVPLITPVIFYNFVTQLCHKFQEFNGPFIVTQGGPLRSTTLVSLLVYNEAFKRNEMGLASAIAWLLFLVIMTFTAVAFISQKYWVYYADEDGR